MFQTAISEHLEMVSALRALESEVERSAERVIESLQRGGKVLLMGNGGSAADAQHIAAELVVRYVRNRPALPAIALTTDSSILTATSNDFGFESLFARQIEALARPEDLVVGISTSGESPNVVKGIKSARERGVETIAMTGANESALSQQADLTLCVPSTVTARIQEAHILIGHYWCDRVEEVWR